jgi:quinoprotein glucose dehydrogenase
MKSISGLMAAAIAMSACSPGDSDSVPAQVADNSAPAQAAASASRVAPGDWVTVNREPGGSRYSPLAQINAQNVASLAPGWTFDGAGGTSVPLVVDGVMYLSAGPNVVALDGDTGDTVWTHALNPPQPAGAEGPGRSGAPQAGRGRGGRGGGGLTASARGVAYWPGDGELGPRVLFMAGSNLLAVDAATGATAEGFGTNGRVTVSPGYGGTPTIYQNVAIIGASSSETVPYGDPGNPRAFDVVTGEKLWEFQTVPQPGQPYNETWGDGWDRRGGTNMWAISATIDAERGIAYLPIAGPAHNYYGGDRPGNNVYGNSIVAVNAETGEYIWHFQTVHHDLWDIDLSSAGVLFDFMNADGSTTPALAYVGKASLMYVLNRVTGEPLIAVEERPVPAGDVPGEWYSPTQPFPVSPPPLSRVNFSEADLVTAEDTTAEHAAACRQQMQDAGGFYNEGLFSPFMYKDRDAPPKSTIQMPGGTGGVNWGGVTIDKTSNIVYANVQNGSLVGWIQEKLPNENSFDAPGSENPYDRAYINGTGPFFSFAAPLGGDARGSAPCFKPPYAELVAVDADTGEIVWRSTLGINASLPEGKQLVGGSGSAGPSVTAGGLVFVGATSDALFRAFDANTGAELWSAALGGQGNANPMSYAGPSGKQHVAIVAGGSVKTFALP